MKIRVGFVSNSSSSSFICNHYESEYNKMKKFNKEEVLKRLRVMHRCAIDLGFLSPETKFEDVFGEVRKATEKDINDLNKGWSTNFKYNKQMFLINSKEDNSIPYELFELIESAFNAERVHLG
jgi:hypothetical protein